MSTQKIFSFLVVISIAFLASFRSVGAVSPLLVKDLTPGVNSTYLYCRYGQVCDVHSGTFKAVYNQLGTTTLPKIMQTNGTSAGTSTTTLAITGFIETQYRLDADNIIINTLPSNQSDIYRYGNVEKLNVITNQVTRLFTGGTAAGISNSTVIVLSHNSGSDHREIYYVNSTTAISTLVKDMGVESITNGQYNIQTLTNGTILFEVATNGYRNQIWKTDGTALGTVQVTEAVIAADTQLVGSLTSLGSFAIYAIAPVTSGTIYEIWRTDGTALGTYRLIQDYTYYGFGSWDNYNGIPQILSVGGYHYFPASNATGGFAIIKTDGTTQGTTAALTIGSSFTTLVVPVGVVNNQLYYLEYYDYTNYKFSSASLIKYDGTTRTVVKSQLTGTNVNFPYSAFALVSGEKLYLSLVEFPMEYMIGSTTISPTAQTKNIFSNPPIKSAPWNQIKTATATTSSVPYIASSYLFKIDTATNTTTFNFEEL